MKINLIDGYYLRVLDKNNVILAKEIITTEGKNIGTKYEKKEGYFKDFTNAWNYAVEFFPKLATSNHEMDKIIRKLQSLKIKNLQYIKN